VHSLLQPAARQASSIGALDVNRLGKPLTETGRATLIGSWAQSGSGHGGVNIMRSAPTLMFAHRTRGGVSNGSSSQQVG
jgi:hypothetical protein